MKSERARKMLADQVDNRSDAARGRGRSVMRFGADSMAAALITDIARMPVVVNTQPLQNASQTKFLFLVGFSAVDGGDVAQ